MHTRAYYWLGARREGGREGGREAGYKSMYVYTVCTVWDIPHVHGVYENGTGTSHSIENGDIAELHFLLITVYVCLPPLSLSHPSHPSLFLSLPPSPLPATLPPSLYLSSSLSSSLPLSLSFSPLYCLILFNIITCSLLALLSLSN